MGTRTGCVVLIPGGFQEQTKESPEQPGLSPVADSALTAGWTKNCPKSTENLPLLFSLSRDGGLHRGEFGVLKKFLLKMSPPHFGAVLVTFPFLTPFFLNNR